MAPGDAIQADIRNGERFEGRALSYFERSTVRLEQAFDGTTTTVEARSGDLPALTLQAPDSDGLLVLAYETTPSQVTYRDWEKFLRFAHHKDFADIEARHDAAGYPRDTFREGYTRHAKALIAVGDGRGADRKMGLETELVALTNPYAADFDGTMRVALTYQGEPRGDAQVEVFDRAPDGTVEITLARTDAEGQAAIPVAPGHEVLLDAVVLRPAPESDAPNAPVWETLWAALTFRVPG